MSDLAGNDDSEWTPPSEAEMKVLAARRERSDKISKVMGDYLLKGYKMLSTSCAECGTILLRDRSGSLYCVACAEVDADNDAGKDDPARVGVSSGGGRGHGRDLAPMRNVVLSGSSSSSEQQSDRAAPPPAPPAAGSVPKDVSAEQRTSTGSWVNCICTGGVPKQCYIVILPLVPRKNNFTTETAQMTFVPSLEFYFLFPVCIHSFRHQM